MGKRAKPPGWLISVKFGRLSVAVSARALTPFLVYLWVLLIRLDSASSEWIAPPEHWLVFIILMALGIPFVISVVSGLMGAMIARRQGRQVRGFVFSGSTLLPDVRVSPSQPGGLLKGRPQKIARVALLTIVAAAALAVSYAQVGLNGPGPFREYWAGAFAAGWSMIALPSALVDLLAVYLWPAPTPRARSRRFRFLALAFCGLIVAWVAVMALFWPRESPFGVIIRSTIGGSVLAGLVLAAAAAASVALAQRVIPRDLRNAAVEAVAVDGTLRASDALSMHETPGFLVTDGHGQLVGWLSRGDALGSPDSLFSDLARPLIDSVPIEAEQRTFELRQLLDPYHDGREVVALVHDGTPVGYIVVARAFEYVTGDSAWSRLADPA